MEAPSGDAGAHSGSEAAIGAAAVAQRRFALVAPLNQNENRN